MNEDLYLKIVDAVDALSRVDDTECSEEVWETIQAVIEDLKSVRDSVRDI